MSHPTDVLLLLLKSCQKESLTYCQQIQPTMLMVSAEPSSLISLFLQSQKCWKNLLSCRMSEARKELPVLYCYSAWSIKGNLLHFGVLYLEAEPIKSFFSGILTASSCLNKRPDARNTFENFRKHK